MGLIKRSRIHKVYQRRLTKRKRLENANNATRIVGVEEEEESSVPEHDDEQVQPPTFDALRELWKTESLRATLSDSVDDEDPDAMEIMYLEKKLGLTGLQSEKNKTRLIKEWKEVDGLGEDLLKLTDDILRFPTEGHAEKHTDGQPPFNHTSQLNSSTLSEEHSSYTHSDNDGNNDSDAETAYSGADQVTHQSVVSEYASHRTTPSTTHCLSTTVDPYMHDHSSAGPLGSLSSETSSPSGSYEFDQAPAYMAQRHSENEFRNTLADNSSYFTANGSKRNETKKFKRGSHDVSLNTSPPEYSDAAYQTSTDASSELDLDESIAAVSSSASVSRNSLNQSSPHKEPSRGSMEETIEGHKHRSNGIPTSRTPNTHTNSKDSNLMNTLQLNESREKRYIPPAKRKDSNDEASFQVQNGHDCVISKEVQKKIVSLVNRIAEGNLSFIAEPIIQDVFVTPTAKCVDNERVFYRTMLTLSKRFSHQVAHTAIENVFTTPSLVGSQTAIITYLTIRVGYQIGEQFLVALILLFEKNWSLLAQWKERSKHTDVDMNHYDHNKSFLRFSVISYSLLYDFGLLHRSGVVTLLQRLATKPRDSETSAFLELRLELLVICLRHTGIKLRAASPMDFGDILKFCINPFRDIKDSLPKRCFYFVEELEDMQRYKFNVHASERFQYIRNWLSTPSIKVHSAKKRENKEIIPPDYVFYIDDWMSIASEKTLPRCAASEDINQRKFSSFLLRSKSAQHQSSAALLDKAKALRFHTDIQNSTFLALAGAVDVRDAVQRLVTVAHKPSQIPQAVSVIFHTALRERLFNAFYPETLMELSLLPSSIGKHYKRSVKQVLLTHLYQVAEYPLRQLIVLAELTAYLIMSPLSNVDTRQLRFTRITTCTSTEGLQRIHLFISQVCKALCCSYHHRNPRKSSEHLSNQIHSVLNYPDITGLFASAAKRLIKKSPKDSLDATRAQAILHIIASNQARE